MKRILLALALLGCELPAFAQLAMCNSATPAVCTPGSPAGDVQVKPQAVPTSTTAVTTYDAYLKSVTISNPTGSAVAFSLCDRQSSPVCLTGAVSIAANTSYILAWPEGRLYWCPGGFTVLAGGSGLTYHAAWRQ